MAVTLTVAELLAALRMGNSAEETAEATRLLAYATEAVTRHAPDAPDVVHNEATIRIAGYLFDQPTASRNAAFANALRNSGAGAILLPYRVHRGGNVSGATATASTPVSGGDGGGTVPSGSDATARAAAATADAKAVAAQTTADTNRELINTLQIEVGGNTRSIADNTRVSNANAAAIRALDLTGYRTAAAQDIIDTRATDGILLARQEAAAADAKAVAAQESAARATAVAQSTIRDPIIEPGGWVDNNAARIFTINFDPAALALDGATQLQLLIGGSQAVQTIVSNQHEYQFAFDIATVTLINNNRVNDETLPLDVAVKNAGGRVLNLYRSLFPIVDAVTGIADVPGLQAALDAKQGTPVAISDVTGLQTALDAAGASTIADPVIEPEYWIDNNDAHTFTVHFDAAALALTGAAKVRLTIQGNPVTVNVASNQHTYAFTFNATASTNISNARSVGQTVRADTFVLDSSDAELYHVIGLLRVVDAAPSAGGGGGRTITEHFTASRVSVPAGTTNLGSFTLNVTKDVPLNVALIADTSTVAGSVIRISQSSTRADFPDTANAEALRISATSGVGSSTPSQREVHLVVLWPHITGRLTMYVMGHQSRTDTATFTNVKVVSY